jgi:hypothetical protein
VLIWLQENVRAVEKILEPLIVLIFPTPVPTNPLILPVLIKQRVTLSFHLYVYRITLPTSVNSQDAMARIMGP